MGVKMSMRAYRTAACQYCCVDVHERGHCYLRWNFWHGLVEFRGVLFLHYVSLPCTPPSLHWWSWAFIKDLLEGTWWCSGEYLVPDSLRPWGIINLPPASFL